MKDFRKLQKACLECIEAWKKENDGKRLPIAYGDYISHCYNYGGDDVRQLYDAYFYDEEYTSLDMNYPYHIFNPFRLDINKD
jgi:hypothetical protein